MRPGPAFLATVVAMAPSVAFGQPRPVGTLWQGARGAVLLTECPPGGDHDEYCRAVAVRDRHEMVRLGAGYTRVKLLWVRRSDGGGPDVLVLGDYGGSGGDADLFAIRFSPKIAFRKLGGERFDEVTVRSGSAPLRLTVPFDIEFFNGAPHAGAIVSPVPAIWRGGDFSVDLNELTHRTYAPGEIEFRALAMREELRSWASDKFPAPRLYPPEARDGTPVTVTALVEMMLSGHADQAHDLLDRAWPRDGEHGDRQLGGKADFWAAVCQAVVREPLWRLFGLARLPHADLIAKGAMVEGGT